MGAFLHPCMKCAFPFAVFFDILVNPAVDFRFKLAENDGQKLPKKPNDYTSQ